MRDEWVLEELGDMCDEMEEASIREIYAKFKKEQTGNKNKSDEIMNFDDEIMKRQNKLNKLNEEIVRCKNNISKYKKFMRIKN